jgi:hypothetical protein
MSNNPTLVKSFNAGAAISARRIVKFGADENTVLQAAAATDLVMGVSTFVAAAIGERVDVILEGSADVEYGGTVTLGAALTSDASGRAVVAAPGVGVNNPVIGRALQAGVVGDIGSLIISQSTMQG